MSSDKDQPGIGVFLFETLVKIKTCASVAMGSPSDKLEHIAKLAESAIFAMGGVEAGRGMQSLIESSPNGPRDDNPAPSPNAIADVANERDRQIIKEGFGHDHDDYYPDGILTAAAISYALIAFQHFKGIPQDALEKAPAMWPFDKEWWKPKGARRDLVRAAALIIAEIDRVDRKDT